MEKGSSDWLDSSCAQCGYTRQLLEQAVVPIFVVDPDGDFLFINDACLKMIGSPSREHSMEYNALALPTVKAAGLDLMLRRCLEGETIETDFEYLSMFGKSVRGHLLCIPVRDELGTVIAAASMISLQPETGKQDEMEGLSQELETTKIEMRKLDRLRKRFIAIVSHELRTPLAPLLGYLQMLQEQKLGPLNPQQQKAVDVATRSTRRLIDQVEKILAVSTEQGSLKPRRLNSLNTHLLLEEAAESMEPLVRQHELELEVLCDHDTPAVAGEQERLSRVLMTLLDNAIKFSKKPGKIRLSASPGEAGGVTIEVANTGDPIPPEERARIFEPFYQVEPPNTRSHGGIGLGLAIVRETVMAHGGSIEVVEREGFDTAIRMELPSPGSTSGIGFRVLVVDHDDQRRKQIATLLIGQNYEVMELDKPSEASASMTSWPPTAMVLAVDDPDGEGVSLLETIRAGGKGRLMPILTVTSNKDPLHKREVLRVGATAVLLAPLDERWVLRLLEAVYPAYF